MAIPIEGYSVVAQLERIRPLLESKQLRGPGAAVIADDDLWRCAFMSMDDAAAFLQSLESLGLNTTKGPDSDAVLISEFDGSITPYCEWLQTAKWEKAVIGWKAGTQPRTVSAREGWDPTVGSGLTFCASSEELDLV